MSNLGNIATAPWDDFDCSALAGNAGDLVASLPGTSGHAYAASGAGRPTLRSHALLGKYLEFAATNYMTLGTAFDATFDQALTVFFLVWLRPANWGAAATNGYVWQVGSKVFVNPNPRVCTIGAVDLTPSINFHDGGDVWGSLAVICLSYNGSQVVCSINGVETTFNSTGNLNLNGLSAVLGRSTGSSMIGRLFRHVIYKSGLNQADRWSVTKALLSAGGFAQCPQVQWEGDSLTDPTDADTTKVTHAAWSSGNDFTKPIICTNLAVGGSFIQAGKTYSVIDRGSQVDALWIDSTRPALLLALAGTNDLSVNGGRTPAQVKGDLDSYLAARKAARPGLRAAAWTITPRQNETYFPEAARQTYNPLVLADTNADFKLDIGNDPTMGQAGQQSNTTYYNSDTVHYVTAGYQLVANTYEIPLIQAFIDLAAPTGLEATAISSTRIDLAWADNATNETGYKIERKTGAGGSWGQIGTAAANATSYSDSAASANTLYYYRVRAYNAAGNSDYSNEASATAVSVPPGTPTLTSLYFHSGDFAYVIWTPADANATSFRIEKSSDGGGAWSSVGTVPANASPGTETMAELEFPPGAGGTTYLVRVVAINAGGESSPSNSLVLWSGDEADEVEISGPSIAPVGEAVTYTVTFPAEKGSNSERLIEIEAWGSSGEMAATIEPSRMTLSAETRSFEFAVTFAEAAEGQVRVSGDSQLMGRAPINVTAAVAATGFALAVDGHVQVGHAAGISISTTPAGSVLFGASKTITLSAAGIAGSFANGALTFVEGDGQRSTTFTPSQVGAATISGAVGGGGYANPADATVKSMAGPAASGIAIAGPTAGQQNQVLNYLVAATPVGSVFWAADTANLAASGGGTLSTATLNLAEGDSSKGFTYSGPAGSHDLTALSVSHGGASLTVVLSSPAIVPLAAGALTSTGRTSSSITLAWSAASGGRVPYTAQLVRDGEDVAGASSSPFMDSGLGAGSTHTYSVRYIDADGQVVSSNALTVTTDLYDQPVSLAEAKAHLRIDTSEYDDLLTSLIAAAVNYCQEYQCRQYLTATRVEQLDHFPWVGHWHGDRRRLERGHQHHRRYGGGLEIRLPYAPLQSITSVKYIDTSGVEQTLDASKYLVDAVSQPGRIAPAYGQDWPDTQDRPAAVSITYVCGYGDASAVPAQIKAAIKLMVAHLFANPSAVVEGNVSELPLGVASILGQDAVSRWF